MQIRLSREVIRKVGINKFTMLKIVADELHWNSKLQINLASLSMKEIEYLEKLISPCTDIVGVKHAIWEISLWLKALKGGEKSQTIKRIQHLESMLYNYVKKLPNYWLFQRHGHEGSEVFVPYYIYDIEYHPPQRGRDYTRPAYLDFDGIYERFGKRERANFYFRESDVVGKKIEEILLKYNLFAGTEELVKTHYKEIERYGDLIPKIGHQFSVHGVTDDDVPGEDRYTHTQFTFAEDRRKNRVVVDAFLDVDGKKEERSRDDVHYDPSYWINKNKNEDDDDEPITDDIEIPVAEIPIHPFLVVFDLFRHLRLACHVTYLKEYVYDEKLASKLILSEEVKSLVTILVNHREGNFKDIVAGKGGGAIILLTGAPGIGKTLTAEVFAEADKKPLYSVQASQLGINAEELEKNLLHVLQRTARWNAILLLDEADVYVHERGDDLTQNAIVGVFLRTLEYHASVLFLTSNRPDLVDDAIASRCVARIDYKYPTKEDQKKIWRVLCESSGIKIAPAEYSKFAEKNPRVSGRDVKNLLKLAGLISSAQKKPITCATLEYVLKFKPTNDAVKK